MHRCNTGEDGNDTVRINSLFRSKQGTMVRLTEEYESSRQPDG